MKYGWAGTILRVNLTEEKVWKTPLEKDLALNYLGGRGLNVKILYDELKLRIDPLGPENILVFGIGPVNGTLAPGSNRYTVSALSPLGNMLGDGNSGGFFGAMLKFAGYDAIVIYGAARKPVYLWIDDESVEIKSADHIWGKTTWETDTIIKKEIGDEDIGMVYIGQAGENLVRYACVMNERARAAARCGIGAVMGSKKLKAIAVRGTKDVSVANPKALIEVIKKNYEALLLDEGYYKAFSIQGSPSLVDLYQDMGALPTKNFQRGTFEGASKISGNVFISDYAVRSKACFSCPLHCSHWYRVEKGPYAGIEGEGLEFETICGFGSRCGNSDLSSILMANELCNKYGLDTISTSSTIAFAIECFEKGLISIEDTGGIKLEWGNHEQIISLIHKIAKREDFGNFLAEGVERMANRIGNEARKIAPVIKGVDIINVDPRGPKAWALGFAVASRGADHLRAFPIGEFHFPPSLAEEMFSTKEAVDLRGIKGKGRLVIWHENIRAIIDSLEICVYNFARTPLSKKILENSFLFPKALAKLINAVTGITIEESNLLKIGERIINLERVFNVIRGFSRKDDNLPERFLKEPLPNGPLKGEVVNLEPMLDEYYSEREWNIETGIPTKDKLIELGLENAIDKLEKSSIYLH